MRKLIFGRKYVQPADLNNSLFINNIASPVVMNGMVTRTTDHKGGNTAIQFGSGNLVSINNLPASTVWSVAFWIKTSQTAIGFIIELTANFNNNVPAFLIWQNQFIANRFSAGYNQGLGQNMYGNCNTQINDGNWHFITVIMNRNEIMNNELKIYVDKVLTSITYTSQYNTSGDFRTDKIYIGGRENTFATPFNGATSPIKMFNYPLTQTEIDNLYNE